MRIRNMRISLNEEIDWENRIRRLVMNGIGPTLPVSEEISPGRNVNLDAQMIENHLTKGAEIRVDIHSHLVGTFWNQFFHG